MTAPGKRPVPARPAAAGPAGRRFFRVSGPLVSAGAGMGYNDFCAAGDTSVPAGI